MAVYYKFKSAKDYESIRMDGHFISVLNLKEKIFASKHLGRGTDFDLVVTNAQTNEEYKDEASLIPKNTSVLIRRVPARPRFHIIAQPSMAKEEVKVEVIEPEKSTLPPTEVEYEIYTGEQEWDDFSNDLNALHDVTPMISNHVMPVDTQPSSKADEDDKIKAVIDASALDWQSKSRDGFGQGRGATGPRGRMNGGRGIEGGGFESKTPNEGYVCHRCRIPGHFIHHCPTNGDPTYNIRKVKPPSGIPKSMLRAAPDGSYALPNGDVAVLRPNEAAFEREIEGLPSSDRSVGDIPPELHCPLCKDVMKDAVLTSKCCFKSYCDKCVREHIIAKSMCVCGAPNVLADDLLPNKTLRDAISRILGYSNTSSAGNAASAHHIQDMESARCPPVISASSKGEGSQGQRREEASASRFEDGAHKTDSGPLQDTEPVAEAQEKASAAEPVKKKQRKKTRFPGNEMQWKCQDFGMGNLMMPVGPSFNPYWAGLQPIAPYPYSSYGFGPMGIMTYGAGCMISQDQFAAPSCSFPQRMREARDHGECQREASVRGSNVNSVKSNDKSTRSSRMDRTCQRGGEGSRGSSRPVEPSRSPKREADRYPEKRKREMDRHRRVPRSDGDSERNADASAFTRIRFPPEEDAGRKRKISSSSGKGSGLVASRRSSSSNGFHASKGKASAEHESRNGDRNSKRKRWSNEEAAAPASERVHRQDDGALKSNNNCVTSYRKLAAQVF